MALPHICRTPLSLINANKIFSSYPTITSLSPSLLTPANPRLSSVRVYSKSAGDRDPLSGKPPSSGGGSPTPGSPSESVPDEWGEKSERDASYTKLSETDPAKDDDEWGSGGAGNSVPGNGSAVGAAVDDKVGGLKRSLVDSADGTNFGFQAASEVRAEISELVSQLEAANPTPAPLEAPELLDGKWFLLYTAFSELLPLIAVGTTPLLKLENISQLIDTSNLSIENSVTFSSPLATVSFSASASFEVQSPSRVQVQFKEGILQPPEIKSNVLPNDVDLFGQRLDLSPIQQALGPLSEFVAGLSRGISGQPPLRISIPGERSRSWLLTTYLDEDLRISRGDGGLFVLVKEGSPLLIQ